MNDKTTEGFTATTADIEGMLRNLCAYALSDPDPLQRYIDLTHQQVLFDGVVAAIRRERGKALGDLAGMGVPLPKVAELAKLETPQRVKSLMTAAGVSVPTPRKPAAKRVAAPKRTAPSVEPDPPVDQIADVPDADGPVIDASSADVSRAAVSSAAVSSAAVSSAAVPVAGVSRGVGELPPAAQPVAKRTLTSDERRALGLPELTPIQRRSSLAER